MFSSISNRFNTLLLLLLVLMAGTIIAILATRSLAGPLDPPGPPASTMKTLNQVEPRTPITSLPFTISQPGSYYLTGDLTMGGAGDGITINVGDVTLDLSGFTIDGGGGGGNGVVVPSGASLSQSITVRNGNADHWTGAGFQLQYGLSIAENIQASHDATGIVIDGGSLTGCTVAFDSGVGVQAAFTAVSNCNAQVDGTGFSMYEGSLSQCVADDSTGTGINVQRGDVASCTLDANFYGIVVAGQSNVHDNTVEFSSSDGIRVSGGSDSMVSDNTVSGSGLSQSASGVYAETNNNRISRNTASSTNGPGIQVVGSYNTIDDNSTFENQGIGIVVTGSKNTVVKNSSTGNVNPTVSTNYSIGAGNNPGLINAANASTDPWSNTQ